MKTHILYIALLAGALGAPAISARTLSPSEALQRLKEDSALTPQVRTVSGAEAQQPVFTAVTSEGAPAVYAFDANNGGFLLVSADDCAYPLLAYSDEGSIPSDTAAMAPALRWWLDEYARQIEWASARGINGGARPSVYAAAGRQAIEPMLTTAWDQDSPYNLQCPTYGASSTYTGCVATAMAQVMNYFKYPEKGTGSVSYNAESIGKRLSLNFARRSFDWDNMLPTYSDNKWTDEQADAVAYLMKACGYAVKMDYGTDSSGALAMNIPKALTDYFTYDGNLSYECRHFYTATQWNDLIYNNLANVGPVIYGGGSMVGGGHSFVCDGYDGNGLFHFNWGWTGMSDGYFSLDALNPYSLGSGGGMGGGYNFTQDALIGVQPPTGQPIVEKEMYLTQKGSFAAVVNGNTLQFDLFAEGQCMWVNYNSSTMYVGFEVLIEKPGDSTFTPRYASISSNRVELEPGYGTSPDLLKSALDLSTLNLADGTYRMTAVTYDYKTADSPRVPVRPCMGYFNYITITKSGSNYTVTNNDVARLEVLSGGISGTYYYGMAAQVSVTVANDSEIEMTRGFAPAVIYNGSVVLLGESVMLTLKPGEQVTREWDTTLYSMTQTFSVTSDVTATLTFYDEMTGNFFSEDILEDFVIHANPGVPDITVTSAPSCPGMTSTYFSKDSELLQYYKITDPSAIPVRVRLRLNEGAFGYPIYACLCNEADATGQMEILNYTGYPVFFDRENQTKTFDTTIVYPGMEPDRLYIIAMAYGYGSNLLLIGPYMGYVCYGDPAGIDDVLADGSQALTFDNGVVRAADGEIITVYSVSGAQVASAVGSLSTSSLAPGVYVARTATSALKISIR